MAAEKKPVRWGQPGETGVTEDGVPWYVPEHGPSRMDRFMEKIFRVSGSYMPVGAKPIPARTAAEVRKRCILGYAKRVASYLDEDERIDGFVRFEINDRVPQPPGSSLSSTTGPSKLKHWWMGGDWNSIAGRLLVAVGGTSGHAVRHLLWVRTNRRVAVMDGPMDNPMVIDFSFGLDQVGVQPGWQPYGGGDMRRVDVAFADGSWLGVKSSIAEVPGGAEESAVRDLLVELAGPPVVTEVQPAVGLG